MKALEFVSDCQGNSTSESQVHTTEGCADWCLWVPGPSWTGIELCHMCAVVAPDANATAADTTESAQGEAEAIGAPKPEAEAKSLRGKSLSFYPNWCNTIPLGSLQYVPDCRGFRGTQAVFSPYCSSWCQWVPSPSWQYVSSCQGCYGEQPGTPNGPYRGGCASWCQWVPTLSWQYTTGCSDCF